MPRGKGGGNPTSRAGIRSETYGRAEKGKSDNARLKGGKGLPITYYKKRNSKKRLLAGRNPQPKVRKDTYNLQRGCAAPTGAKQGKECELEKDVTLKVPLLVT